MLFDPRAYGQRVAEILALDGDGGRRMPLAGGQCSSARALELLNAASARELFAGARAPEAALAGLYLYFSCWDEAHRTAQDIDTPEGSYWHAIVHRQEPDAGNSTYWFNRVGRHAVFPALRDAAAAAGYDSGAEWDPIGFIRYSERARASRGSAEESRALAIQLAEWQLLFDYCAAKRA